MPEPTRRPRARAGLRKVAARVAALVAVAVLAGPLTLPASALGEDGTFTLPVESETVSLVPGSVTRLPLRAVVQDDAEDEIDFDSARLAVPQDLDEGTRELMEVGDDDRSITVPGEGTWTLIGQELVFTPLSGVQGASTPIAVTIGSTHDTRSLPAVLTPELVELEDISVHGSAGEVTEVPLDQEIPEGGTVRLELAGLPAGSTLLADGSRATVPDQGVWQLSADGSSLSHTPSGPGLGRQLDPVRLVVEDPEGAVVQAGEVSVTVPIISDLDWSAPYGQDILFVVGEGQQYIDPSTLRLQPLAGEEGVEVSEDGTTVVVPDQGTWQLDRDRATVRFSPESDQVRTTAPMGITGGDGEGATAATALLSTAYPVLLDRAEAATPGNPIQFDLTTGIRDVRSDSLRFDRERLPEGAELSEDGTEVVVEGEGTWTIDFKSRTVTMTPAEGFVGEASPVGLTGQGVYADNTVDATFEAVVAPEVATLRDDEQLASPGSPVTVDILGNDTAASGSQPLDPETVEIGSLSATNLSELEGWRGKRLVIPEEGVYTVGENGSVTFAPDEDFVGRTTPITYYVRDNEGVPASAELVIDEDPTLTGSDRSGAQVSGINSLLIGLLPSSPATATVYLTIVLLLLFGGGVALWIGVRMEADRRAWQD
ncbi:Ig-like domain-containing protein [Brachybacterium sp. GCM10030267]|uniref:Ig-like domain-containing protein n=1 Tax=unclassified Brachybacterium TaxID=2623841 RepID=UPI00360BBBEC